MVRDDLENCWCSSEQTTTYGYSSRSIYTSRYGADLIDKVFEKLVTMLKFNLYPDDVISSSSFINPH